MKKSRLSKEIKLLSSMNLGIALLIILAVVSIFGSIIPQEREISFYENHYSEFKANIILSFGLNDIYRSWYFIALFGLLSINLTLCSIRRIGVIIKKMNAYPTWNPYLKTDTIKIHENQEEYINGVFEKHGIKKVVKKVEGDREFYLGKKNSVGYLGSWLIHLGLLIVIIAYGYGQYTNFSTNVYGVPGSVLEVEGTNLMVAIEDFRIDYREDGSVNQYYTDMTLLYKEGEIIDQEEIYVNNPLSYKGYNFYQSATGWAADLMIMKEDILVADIIYESTVFIEEDQEIAIHFTKFYPDFIATDRGFFTRSPLANNPMFLYSLFYNGIRVDMNIVAPGDVIQWENYQIWFENPRMYTYLQVNKLNGKISALFGSFLALIGLFFAFYVKPSTLMIKREKNKLHIFGNNTTIDYGYNHQKTSIEL